MKASYQKINWCIEQHTNTNHYYDKYLPYRFHLEMVDTVAEQFEHLLDATMDYFTGEKIYSFDYHTKCSLREACRIATYGHDLIEDTRTSYNDIKSILGQEAAEIIYALTNEKGKTRSERANDRYYEGIRNTPGATFVKLCDRIANVQYSKMTKSRMFEQYKDENENFMSQLSWYPSGNHKYKEMFNYLVSLFQD
jgi:(p)ppGpp synthase/HD superfamily hydrolase